MYVVYYYMEIVRVTRRYQVAIPPSVRRKLHIKAGDRLRIKVEGGRIVLEHSSSGISLRTCSTFLIGLSMLLSLRRKGGMRTKAHIDTNIFILVNLYRISSMDSNV